MIVLYGLNIETNIVLQLNNRQTSQFLNNEHLTTPSEDLDHIYPCYTCAIVSVTHVAQMVVFALHPIIVVGKEDDL
jgi:hypothetical protein